MSRDLIDLPSLQPLFRPKSVAVIGASSDPLKIGGRPVDFLKIRGYQGRIIPINPKSDEIQGLPAYPHISKVEGQIDLVICSVPGRLAVEAVADCSAKGVASMIMFSAGFAEVGEEGAAEQRRLAAQAREAGMRLMGPNCMGIANMADGMIASFHPVFAMDLPKGGKIGLVSQSGAFGGLCMNMARERGIAFSHMITTGNEADVQAAECLAFLAHDAETEVILLYLEGCRSGPQLLAALELARANRKPVVAIKLGRTDTGAKAAQSHTAALAGADQVFDAVFRQFDVLRTHTIEEFFDIACAVAVGGLPANNRVGIVTVSGGVGVLMADDAESRGLDVAELPEQTQAKFKQIVPFAAVRNPLDVTGQVINDRTLLQRAMDLVLSEGDYGSIVCFQGSAGALPDRRAETLDAWMKIRERYKDKLIAIAGLNPPDYQQALEAHGMPAFRDPTHGIRAVAAMNGFARAFERPWSRPAVAATEAALRAGPYNEVEAMAVLRDAGLPVVDELLTSDPDEAVEGAEAVGYPVVMKVVSADIVHKSDVGGVKLNLENADAVRAAFNEITAAARAAEPAAAIDGCLVAPMVDMDGIETILGVTHDVIFGPVVMFGLGGILVEILEDVTFRAAPFDTAEAHRMIRELRAFKVLQGVRGRPPADIDALAEALASLSQFAAAHAGEIESLDANPFLVRPAGQGAIALDAVLTLRSEEDGA